MLRLVRAMGCSGTSAFAPREEIDVLRAAPVPATVAEAPVMDVAAGERALTQLKIIFDSIDGDKNYSIDRAELAKALRRDPNLGALLRCAGCDENCDLLDQLDANKDGRVDWNEFQQHLKRTAQFQVIETGNVLAADMPAADKARAQLKTIFCGMDTNNDGALDRTELDKCLREAKDLSKLIAKAGLKKKTKKHDVLEQLDTNGDGRICWDEFEDNLLGAATEEVKTVGIVAAALLFEEDVYVDEFIVDPPTCGMWCGRFRK